MHFGYAIGVYIEKSTRLELLQFSPHCLTKNVMVVTAPKWWSKHPALKERYRQRQDMKKSYNSGGSFVLVTLIVERVQGLTRLRWPIT